MNKFEKKFRLKKQIEIIETEKEIKILQLKLLDLKIKSSVRGRFESMSTIVNPSYSIDIKPILKKKEILRKEIINDKNKISKLKAEYKYI